MGQELRDGQAAVVIFPGEGLEVVLLDVEGVCGLLGPEELATGAAGSGAAAADEDEEHEACKQGDTDEMGNP